MVNPRSVIATALEEGESWGPGSGLNLDSTSFSRGAYTARALAGLIMSQGVLAKPLTVDKSNAYRSGAQAWYAYRKKSGAKKVGFFQRLVEATANLPAFLSREDLRASDLVAVPKIKAVGVWDTVGAMGLPRYIEDERADAFKFTDTRLNPNVANGFHAIALDEQRKDFTPTLCDQAGNVTQFAFPGAHADIGGGYTINNNESGLSDIALEWMAQQLTGIGVRFDAPVYTPFNPDPKGAAHKSWTHPPFTRRAKRRRAFFRAAASKNTQQSKRASLPGRWFTSQMKRQLPTRRSIGRSFGWHPEIGSAQLGLSSLRGNGKFTDGCEWSGARQSRA